MKKNFLASAFIAIAQAGFLCGQDSVIRVRAVLNNPSGSNVSFYVGGPGKSMVPLNLVEEGLGEPQNVTTENDGLLNIFKTATVDPGKPSDALAASVKIPAGAKSVIAIIVPGDKGPLPYRMVVINDGPGAFPWGESKVLNITPVDFAVEAGGERMLLPGGKITAIPKVTKVDEYNRAQTNFYYKDGDQWVTASERQMQYISTIRRLFLIYKPPNAIAPDVRSIIDQPPAVLDASP